MTLCLELKLIRGRGASSYNN